MQKLRNIIMGTVIIFLFISMNNYLEINKAFCHHVKCDVDRRDEGMDKTCITQMGGFFRCDGSPEPFDWVCRARIIE